VFLIVAGQKINEAVKTLAMYFNAEYLLAFDMKLYKKMEPIRFINRFTFRVKTIIIFSRPLLMTQLPDTVFKRLQPIKWFEQLIKSRHKSRIVVRSKLDHQNDEIAALLKIGVMTKDASKLLTKCRSYEKKQKVIIEIMKDYAKYCKFHSNESIKIKKIHLIGISEMNYLLNIVV
jgi:hypothetical protein